MGITKSPIYRMMVIFAAVPVTAGFTKGAWHQAFEESEPASILACGAFAAAGAAALICLSAVIYNWLED